MVCVGGSVALTGPFFFTDYSCLHDHDTMKQQQETHLKRCAVCSTPLEETARFCPQCGRPVEHMGETQQDDNDTASRFEELRVVDTQGDLVVSPAPVASPWPDRLSSIIRWLALAGMIAALAGLAAPWLVLSDHMVVKPNEMLRELLVGFDLATAASDAAISELTAGAIAAAPTDAEAMAVRVALAWLALGPLWMLSGVLLQAIPLARGRNATRTGFLLVVLWLLGAWPVVYLLGMQSGVWLDLFSMTGAGFWLQLTPVFVLEILRRFV